MMEIKAINREGAQKDSSIFLLLKSLVDCLVEIIIVQSFWSKGERSIVTKIQGDTGYSSGVLIRFSIFSLANIRKVPDLLKVRSSQPKLARGYTSKNLKYF
ncbi:hypothetical protein FRC18_004652 [Serendipita sp. 400]|nr:hypothetical protein FRC18_004652 [Serendipita sp. 400]